MIIVLVIILEEKKYQNYRSNELLENPELKDALIYSAVEPGTLTTSNSNFLPTWDDTDHLHFACSKCKSVADILTIRFFAET